MDKASLKFNKINIHRAHTISSGILNYDNLSDNINIISGPNASGKSTTAKVIQKFIWRQNTDGIFADANAKTDDKSWNLKIESKLIRVTSNGNEEEINGIPAYEAQKRYLLSLDDLIKDNEQDLAAVIIKESFGGYDLNEAKNNLGYAPDFRSRTIKEKVNFDEASKNYYDVFRKQEELKTQEQRLEELEIKKNSAIAAKDQTDFYKKLQEYFKINEEYIRYKTEYEAFDKAYNKLTGEEYNNIKELENSIESNQKEVAQIKTEINLLTNKLDELKLPDKDIDEDTLEILESNIALLRKKENEQENLQKKLSELTTKIEAAVNKIDSNIEIEKWEGLQLSQVQRIEKLWDKAVSISFDKDKKEKEIEQLKQITGDTDADKDTVDKGISALIGWLTAEGLNKTRNNFQYVIAAAVIGLLSAASTFLFGIIPLITGVVILAVVAYLASKNKSEKPGVSRKDIYKEDYLKTGLEKPSKWDNDNVKKCLDDLFRVSKDLIEKDRTISKLNGLKIEYANISKIYDEQVVAEFEKLKNEIKAVPDLPDPFLPDSHLGLKWFIESVYEWYDNHSNLKETEKKLNIIKDEIDGVLLDINSVFNNCNFSSVKVSDQAAAILRNLRTQVSERKELRRSLNNSNLKIPDKEKFIESEENKLRGIYEKLDIEQGQNHEVHQMVERLDDFISVKKQFESSKNISDSHLSALKMHSLYKKTEHNPESISMHEIELKIEEYDKEANQYDDINNEITQIKTKINIAGEGKELAEALAEKEKAFEDLQKAYHKNLSSVAGDLIVEKLKSSTQKQHSSIVFKKANEIFNNITGGKYELQLENLENPEFLAKDTVNDLTKNINELSTGTRVQLILSVRLAFIETQETILKIPLLADELLANSDDLRAKAIIDALITVSKNGRQVFYFTAQDDEVAKWKTITDNEKNQNLLQIIYIGDKREQNERVFKAAKNYSDLVLYKQVEKPGNRTHLEYGQLINVPEFDLLNDKINKLHLWYLIEDNEVLYNCLVSNINVWGQLESFINHNGKIKNLDEDTIKVINEKVRLLTKLKDLYQKGRHKNIDAEIIEKADAVSDTHNENVINLAAKYNYNPVDLIQALRNKEVANFRTAKIDELEDLFTEKGYIDNQKQLTKEEIAVQISAILSQLELDEKTAANFLKNFNI